MRSKVFLVDKSRLICELDSEEELVPAEPRLLDLARRIRPELSEVRTEYEGSQGEMQTAVTYTDDYCTYFCVHAYFRVSQPRGLGRDDSSMLDYRPVWFRSAVKCSPSYDRMEPDDYDEVLLDRDHAYLSLPAAVAATLHDLLDQRLEALDNACGDCFGGSMVPYREEQDAPCKSCGGAGYTPLPDPIKVVEGNF